MEQRNIKILLDLIKRPGNGQCADCGSKEVEYASYNIGIFLCPRCTSLHNQMGTHISKTKHLKLDHWEDSQIERMKQVGNLVAKAKYEARVPVGFRRPMGLMGGGSGGGALPPDPQILLDHWITSKYTREEFIDHYQQHHSTTSSSSSDQQQQQQSSQSSHSNSSASPLRPYLHGIMESFLMKKGREDPRYFPRRFVLDPTTLRYFVKEKTNPKAVIRLIDLDVCLNPVKCINYTTGGSSNNTVNNVNNKPPSSCLQLSYLKDGSSRHLYLFHDDPELVMQWYQALRIGKLGALKEKCSRENVYVAESVLLSFLPQDSLMEGYLWKAGPSPSYAHRRRWFTLSPHRKLMYHIDPLDAYPKGEIFLGTSASSLISSTTTTSSSADAFFQSTTATDKQYLDQTIPTASKIFDIDIKKPESLNLTGFKVSLGGFGDDKMDPQRWVFSLHTPYRTFVLAAETQAERDKWVAVLDHVLRSELSPRDVATCSILVRKRNGSTLANISVSNPLSGLLSSSSSSSTPTGGGGITSSLVNTSCSSNNTCSSTGFSSSSSIR